MDAEDWHARWADGRIGFHEGHVNTLLARHVAALGTPGHVFVPLCGKAFDLMWLAERGWRVTGVELSERAARDFFAAFELTVATDAHGPFKRFQAGSITILVGDVFDLGAEELGAVDAVYDRAALVALPDDMRRRYAAHVQTVSARARQVLITFEYDQAAMKGPPFSVTEDTVHELYAGYDVRDTLETAAVELRGTPALERIWSLALS